MFLKRGVYVSFAHPDLLAFVSYTFYESLFVKWQAETQWDMWHMSICHFSKHLPVLFDLLLSTRKDFYGDISRSLSHEVVSKSCASQNASIILAGHLVRGYPIEPQAQILHLLSIHRLYYMYIAIILNEIFDELYISKWHCHQGNKLMHMWSLNRVPALSFILWLRWKTIHVCISREIEFWLRIQ